MEELKNRLAQLLDKNDWTQNDKQWFLQYLEQSESQELRALLFEEFCTREVPTKNLSSDTSLELLNMIHDKIGATKVVRPIAVFTLLHKQLAAAAIIGLCIITTYLVVHNQSAKNIAGLQMHGKSIADKKLKNDIEPGGSKAVLTLADGSTIVLDNARNGTLAHQGKTKVFKIDGKLAYNSTNTGADQILFNTITTPRGGEYQVLLPDGSQVWLNAASSLRFPTSFNGDERRVKITGEAYFEVAKNASMPFIVELNSSEVKVLGTHFNIMAYNEEELLKTTLLEGSVQFTSGNNKLMLRPGEQSQLVANGQAKVLRGINLEEVVAWKNGMFHFAKTDVETMMRQISRWYDVDIVYQGRNNDEKFNAEIPRNTNLSDALKALELTGKIHFEVEGRKVIVK